jgi:hypothetical protein
VSRSAKNYRTKDKLSDGYYLMAKKEAEVDKDSIPLRVRKREAKCRRERPR